MIKPTGAVWVTLSHKYVMVLPCIGKGGFLASEILGALKSLLFPNEILSCMNFQHQKWLHKMPKPETSS